MHIPRNVASNPIVRPLATFVLLCLAVYCLLAHWEERGSTTPKLDKMGNLAIHILPGSGKTHKKPGMQITMPPAPTHTQATPPPPPAGTERAVIAHFMLGNTYPFTEADWAQTLDLAEDTGLDALSLNLGPEPWQMKQAQTAYKLVNMRLENQVIGRRPVRLLLSLDLNVLPHSDMRDANILAARIASLMGTQAQFEYGGEPVLTTFGGHDASWGGRGWPGFLDILKSRLGRKPMFWPGFFMNANDFLARDYVDGVFAWNNAWPISNGRTGLSEDLKFLHSDKPYMAAVSPLFYTHYGRTGEWAFDKNFLYRSDDLLYPSRWALLMGHREQPNIIQVTSWNDYGESHYIAPMLGAEPGSSNWTKGMDHIAFREMTRYFTHRWRDGAPEVSSDTITLWLWYRTHPAKARSTSDAVGPPRNQAMAHDLINVVVLVPSSVLSPQLEITLGPEGTKNDRTIPLMSGRMTSFKVPFTPGHVRVKVKSVDGTHLSVWGRDIDAEVETYNFNMWSGAWHAKVVVPDGSEPVA